MKIIDTDNFGRDYPDEEFVNLPSLNEEHAGFICKAINECLSVPGTQRYYRVVKDDYKLQPGFEP